MGWGVISFFSIAHIHSFPVEYIITREGSDEILLVLWSPGDQGEGHPILTKLSQGVHLDLV